ncbi:hypothetical protein GT352_28145 [Streptomyces sp. SID1046]|uniref:DUF6197 family protein n=1 Tax=Streptomyces sp. SID1046 TaxID=2690249 RepID=UPI00136CEA81|nr:hypothetical protein [Streptomyces sp. SID1046]MYV77773.1 hypothetical protein [Streptomyces sp. SID1046]
MNALAPAAALVAAAPALTLDERLALAGLAMDDRLDRAALAVAIRTAPIEIPEILVDPQPSALAAPTTAADVLHEAGRLIREHGWMCGYVGSAATGYCVIGAIRTAAGGNHGLEDGANDLLLERIRAEQPDALSIGAWNDAQSGPTPVIRMLGR